jgi:hypothetical protein
MSLYETYKKYIDSKKRNEINIEKMTLREVMELTKSMPIRDGGLAILIEKIVSSIEKLEKDNEIKSP